MRDFIRIVWVAVFSTIICAIAHQPLWSLMWWDLIVACVMLGATFLFFPGEKRP